MTRDECHIGDRLWLHRGPCWHRVVVEHLGTRNARLRVEHNDHKITKPYEQLYKEPKH